jgi:hypothetical protein
VGHALDLLDLGPNDLLIDLGSGDGAVVKAAAARGWRAVGYEINPLLCLVALVRTLHQRGRVAIKWRDFWLADIPKDTKAIFVFLAGPHMPHLARKLTSIMAERDQPLKVLSYGFAIPGYLPKKLSNGLYLYELKPGKIHSHEPEWNLPVKKKEL